MKAYINVLRHATETTCTPSGQGRNYTAGAIRKRNFIIFWRKICSRCMIQPGVRDMRFGRYEILEIIGKEMVEKFYTVNNGNVDEIVYRVERVR